MSFRRCAVIINSTKSKPIRAGTACGANSRVSYYLAYVNVNWVPHAVPAAMRTANSSQSPERHCAPIKIDLSFKMFKILPICANIYHDCANFQENSKRLVVWLIRESRQTILLARSTRGTIPVPAP